MSASLSFPTNNNNNKWKKRKRGENPSSSSAPKTNKRSSTRTTEEEDEFLDEEDELEDDGEDEDLNPPPPPATTTPPPPPPSSAISTGPTELLSSDCGTQISNFPFVIKRTVNRPHSSVLAIVSAELQNHHYHHHQQQLQQQPLSPIFLENISHGQLQALAFVPPYSPSLSSVPCQYPDLNLNNKDESSNVPVAITPPPIIEGRGVGKRLFDDDRELVVPMHSDWFSPNSVHRLERQMAPHFFSGKSGDHNPEKYMECRNRIVAKYMENQEERISVADCQVLVPNFDVHDLNRIVRFLDHWGIINYSAPPPIREPRIGSEYLKENESGELEVPSAALRSIDSLIHFDKPQERFKPTHIASSSSSSFPGDYISNLEDKIWELLSENKCCYCSKPLPRISYQSQKEVDTILCSECFDEGRFVTGHSSIDFLRVDSTKYMGDLDGDSWTDQETLLLLEAVEKYNNNWNEIAEHVGTKSKAQCITHFIRMPMEDDLLENIEVPTVPVSNNNVTEGDQRRFCSSSNGNSAGLRNHDIVCELPFTTSENPVMALVAFLAYAIGPRVAAACAHGSLAALSKEEHLVSTNGVIPTEGPLPDDIVKMAAKCGLAAATMKAKLFADHEEREIQRMTATIINHQLKRLELKLKQFAEVEGLLLRECEQVEKTRLRFMAERARIISTRFAPTAATSVPVAASTMMNNSVNDRQQIVTPSQMNIPGYSNNQQSLHAQMSFMQRQQQQPTAFGFGPRLPLSAIHPPTSAASANLMFSAPQSSNNAAPSLGQYPMFRPVPGSSKNLG